MTESDVKMRTGCTALILLILAGTVVESFLYHNEICEGGTMDIICVNPWDVIHIVSTEYGRLTSYESQCFQQLNSSNFRPCLSLPAQSKVEEMCGKKPKCRIPVTMETFKYRPCPGMGISLTVRYKCESSNPPPTTSTHPTEVIWHSTQHIWPSISLQTDETIVPTCGPSVGLVRCPRCLKRNITWPETKAGEWAIVECPNNAKLFEARLKCGSNPVEWIGWPDLSKCVSSEVGSVHEKLRSSKGIYNPNIYRSVAVDLVHISRSDATVGGDMVGLTLVMQELVNQLNVSAGDGAISGEVMNVVQQVSGTVMEVTNNFLANTRGLTWNDISQDAWGSVGTSLMSSVETSAFQLANTLTRPQKVTNITDNLVLQVHLIEALGTSSMEDAIFPSGNDLRNSQWENSSSSIRLPAKSLMSLSHKGHVKVVFTAYNNLERVLLPNVSALRNWSSDDSKGSHTTFCSSLSETTDCNLIINTKIISAAVNSRKVETELKENVIFTLQHLKTEGVSNPQCMYWKIKASIDSGGEWSSEGCQMISSNSTHTTCSCNHLTSFAIIMSPTSTQITGAHALALDILTYIGCSISIICLFLCFLTFTLFRNLQNDRNTIHKNLVACLFVFNMIFLIGIDLYNYKILCSVIAGFLHYFLLVAFCWMCIEGIQLCYMLIKVFESGESHVLWFYLSAYGIPAIIVIISASVYHQGYGTEHYCWLTVENGFIWAFLAPAIAILLANCVMLGIAITIMCRHGKSTSSKRIKEKSRIETIGFWVKGAIVLVVLLGTTWIFGLLFVNEATIVFAYIFTILNSFQGASMFIFHCLLNEKVRAEYRRCVRNAAWLPEGFRSRFSDYKSSSLVTGTASRSSHSSTSGNTAGNYNRYIPKYLRSTKTASVTTSTSLLTPQQSIQMPFEEPNEQNSIVTARDSSTRDQSDFLDGEQMEVGEAEYQMAESNPMMRGSETAYDYMAHPPGQGGEELMDSSCITKSTSTDSQNKSGRSGKKKTKKRVKTSNAELPENQRNLAACTASQHTESSLDTGSSADADMLSSQLGHSASKKSGKNVRRSQKVNEEMLEEPYENPEVDEGNTKQVSASAKQTSSNKQTMKMPKFTDV